MSYMFDLLKNTENDYQLKTCKTLNSEKPFHLNYPFKLKQPT